MKLIRQLCQCLALFVIAVTSYAAPVAEDQQTPIDLRRTTLVVKDIDRSLLLYRDALGMAVIYDNLITTPRNSSIEQAERALRLVFLRANDDYIGIIGLLQYLKPEKETINLTDSSFKTGTVVLVFNSMEAESYAKAIKVEGVKVIEAPSLVSYPAYDGKGSISVLVSALQDPDGFTFEINQFNEPLH